jgi:hypothetical protein
MNSVIIPEENVTIRINGIHLSIILLNIIIEVGMDSAMIMIARVIGFRDLNDFMVMMVAVRVIFLFYFWFTKSMFCLNFGNFFWCGFD